MNTGLKALVTGLGLSILASTCNAATVSKYGNVLRIDGEVDYQTQLDFKKQFTNEVTEIVLKSYGGSTSSAYSIMEMISKKRNITTTAEEYCQSACAMIWLMGHNHKNLKPNVIGLHLSLIHISEPTRPY